MKLVEQVCKCCGAAFPKTFGASLTCEYCGSVWRLDKVSGGYILSPEENVFNKSADAIKMREYIRQFKRYTYLTEKKKRHENEYERLSEQENATNWDEDVKNLIQKIVVTVGGILILLIWLVILCVMESYYMLPFEGLVGILFLLWLMFGFKVKRISLDDLFEDPEPKRREKEKLLLEIKQTEIQIQELEKEFDKEWVAKEYRHTAALERMESFLWNNKASNLEEAYRFWDESCSIHFK